MGLLTPQLGAPGMSRCALSGRLGVAASRRYDCLANIFGRVPSGPGDECTGQVPLPVFGSLVIVQPACIVRLFGCLPARFPVLKRCCLDSGESGVVLAGGGVSCHGHGLPFVVVVDLT